MSEQETLPARISRIEHQLAIAATPSDIKQVIAVAEAAIAFAKSLGREFVEAREKAEHLKLDAERKLGGMLAAMPKAIGGRPAKTPTNVEGVSETTIADVGVDYKTSARVQKIAALPEETIQAIKAGEITVNKAIAPAAKADAPKQEKPAEVAEVDQLRARIKELEASNAELRANLDETLADNESMAKSFEGDDRLGEALADAKKWRAEVMVLRQRVNGLMNEKNEAVRSAKSWQRKAEKVAHV